MSSSRSRRKDSDDEKPKRKSIKGKKKSDTELPSKEEVEKVITSFNFYRLIIINP